YGDSTLTVAAVVVLPALIFGFLILETRAWFRYQVLRAVLAARRELPWRLTQFLEDSREVDLLRHAAGAYQFRHVRLQEQLADENLTDETARVTPRALVRIRRALVAAAAVAVTVSLAVPLAALPRDRSTRTIQLGYGVGASEVVINAPGDVLAIHTGDEVLLRALPKGERIKDIAVDDDSGYPHFNDTGQVLILNQPGEAGPSARPARAVATHNGRELTTAVQGQDLVLLPGGTGYGRISYGDADEESVLEIYDDYGGQLGKVRGEFADQVLAPRPNEGNSYEPYVDDGPPIIFSGSVAADAVTVWDVRDPEQPKSVIREAGGLPSVEGVNASGSRMMIQADDGVRLFDVNTGARVSTLDYDETSSMPSFSPDGSRIVGITGGLRGIEEDNDRLRVWKAESGEVILDRPVPLDVQGTIMDRDDRLLIIDTPGPDDSVSVLEIFSIVTGRPIRTLKNVRNYATTQSSSASRMQIEISDPGSEELERVEIIDLKTGSVVTDIDVGDFEVSVDSDDVYSTNAVDEAIPFILGSRNEGQEMAAWNAVTGASVLPAGSEPWDSYRISPRGDMFVAEDDDALTLYKATGRSTGRKLANDGFDEIDVDSDRNDSESKVRFSPDGAFVAGVGSGDEEVQAWDAHTGCPVATLSGHAGASLSLTWGRGPSAHTLITSGQRDDTVRLWKMPSGRDC
ncbi:MAG: WD40 repeat domain-containing protein, partial [Jiangellaceae bacterium]